MLIAWIMLILGLVLLIKGADWFVDGAAGLAGKMGISPLVIGLTIVAFGTSAPEAAVSIASSIKGSGGITIGNVVGSNLFNLLCVVGIGSIMRPSKIEGSIMKKDFPFSMLATLVLAFTMMDKVFKDSSTAIISRSDGFILLAFFVVFMYYTVSGAISQKNTVEKKEEQKPYYLLIIMLVIGIAAVICGGQAVVNGASSIARAFGVSETLIGLTIVAVGTSLPELVTSVTAIRKGEDSIAIGNVVGSNIFNILFIVGIGAGIRAVNVDSMMIIDVLSLLGINLLFYLSVIRKKIVTRYMGIIMVAVYAAYMVYAAIR